VKSNSLKIAPANVADFRELAYKRLPRQMFDYIDGGSYDEITLDANVNAFQQTQLRQRILKDVSAVDTSTSLFGKQLSMPLVLAPVGLAGCYARRGEVQTAKAAETVGVPFTLSTVGICPIEEVAANTSQPFWFQLYVIRDREYAKGLLKRAQRAGCDTLVFTVDLPVLGERYRDLRNGLSGAHKFTSKLRRAWDIASHPAWVWDVAIKGKPLTFGSLQDAVPDARALADFKYWVDEQFDPTVIWEDLSWVRDNWSGNIVLKGILDVEDAKQAVAIGAEGIVVSNHGGRQLDGAPSTLQVLPEIATAVKGKTTILVDGGIRSGLDVVKAIASGADACLLGRAWAYALAAQGQQGVEQMLNTMHAEMRIAMALTGTTCVKDIDSSVLY
jgi:L-lactate dehydrogenase (cytochrome)